MSIILMRHGRPLLKPSAWIAPAAMGEWIADYERASVAAEPPVDSLALARTADCLISSTAPRALSSLAAMGLQAHLSDACFGEAGLPFALWRRPRLPPILWAACFRLLWLCGYARGSESLAAARLRASKAAQTLLKFAEQGSVLLLGHGVMNRLIAAELRAAGWSSDKQQRNAYWSASIYRRSAHSSSK